MEKTGLKLRKSSTRFIRIRFIKIHVLINWNDAKYKKKVFGDDRVRTTYQNRRPRYQSFQKHTKKLLIIHTTYYRHTMAKSLILCGPNSRLVFCRNLGWSLENMVLTVPKWVLLNWPKIRQNLSAQKFGISMKKGFIGR